MLFLVTPWVAYTSGGPAEALGERRDAMRAKHGVYTGDACWGCIPGSNWRKYDFLFMQGEDFQLFTYLPLYRFWFIYLKT